MTDVSDQVGVFLPAMGFYSELDVDFPFIVTSCNYTGQPIIYKDEEAQRFLKSMQTLPHCLPMNGTSCARLTIR